MRSERKCLMCGKMFASVWIGNRRCRRCQERLDNPDDGIVCSNRVLDYELLIPDSEGGTDGRVFGLLRGLR